MKANTFRLIIILMSISLLGLVSLQIVWISNAYELKQQQFDNTVNTTLKALAQKIEDIENTHVVLEKLLTGVNEDSSRFIFNIDSTIETIDPQINWVDSQVDIELHHYLPDEETTRKLDSIVKGNSKGVVVMQGDVIKNEDKSIITKKIGDVKKTFVKVITEITETKPTTDIRLELVNFDSLLTSTITQYNLGDTFVAQVMEDDIVKWGTDSLLRNEKVYTSAVFPDDITANNTVLKVQFPSSHLHILGNIVTLLGFSILFTIIIIITFYISLKTLLKQKKISEIKNDFINNMTHEFKTPIATISLAAESIAKPDIIGNKKKLEYYSDVISQENKRMLNHVESILQISLLDKQELNLNKTNVNIHHLLDNAVNNIQLQLEKSSGNLTKNYQAYSADSIGDTAHLVNSFINLLDNAIKYSDEAPHITIHTENKDNRIIITFTDKGIGMKEETLKQVFDKFFRAHTGDVHNVKGFGLGLSYVKAIITAHNGSVQATSKYGKGSSFIVTLPINE